MSPMESQCAMLNMALKQMPINNLPIRSCSQNVILLFKE
jgi:hypothetical protein